MEICRELLEQVRRKLRYFGHLMQRADSLEKTLMTGKTEGRRRRGQQRMSWFQYSCLENPMDGGAWWAAISGVAQSRT